MISKILSGRKEKASFVNGWFLVLILILTWGSASAQVYEKVFSFTQTGTSTSSVSGELPCGVVLGRDGNFYGTTQSGGTRDDGTVFKMTSAGVVTTLVNFTGGASGAGSGQTRGQNPSSALIQGNDGNLYGTTTNGGVNGIGTIFSMTPAGVITTLVDFGGNVSGVQPTAGLIQASDGNFYGTTSSGGTNGAGTVFKMTPTGSFTTVANFSANGPPSAEVQPIAGLIQGGDGNFYGTTYVGGANGFGTVYRLTPGGSLTTLVDFTGSGTGTNRGSNPNVLIQGSDGNFYGTTYQGGANDDGTIFKMSLAGSLTTLIDFTYTGTTNRGGYPSAGLTEGSDGNFYGTATYGGANNDGTFFRMTPSGTLTTLIDFTGNGATNRGAFPQGELIQGGDGNLYGVAKQGGLNGSSQGGFGTLFKVTSDGSLTTLVDFAGGSPLGAAPNSLVQGNDGNLYGTTLSGGAASVGTIFKITPNGVLTSLIDFTSNGASNRGSYPNGVLIQGNDGNFYGTTELGGLNTEGTVFSLTPAGTLTTLIDFTGNGTSNRGSDPAGGLIQDSNSNFYGTTTQGGANGLGTVFEITAGVLTTLVDFTGNGTSNRGCDPVGSLVQDNNGNFYGVTAFGGSGSNGTFGNGNGTIFKLTPTGTLTTLVDFTGLGTGQNRGAQPTSDLIFANGNLYGTTNGGGAYGFGTVFMMTPTGSLTTLVDLNFNSTTYSGYQPVGLILAGDGNFYGATGFGRVGSVAGGNSEGTLFQMNPTGTITPLYDFAADPFDTNPMSDLIQGSDGNLYGTTSGGYGGQGNGQGAIYRLIFPGAPNVYLNAPGEQSTTSTTVSLLANARGATTNVTLQYGTDGTTFPNSIPLIVNLSGYSTTRWEPR